MTMATGKKALIVFTSMSADELRASEDPHIVKIRQKGALAPLKVEKDLKTEAGAGSAGGQTIWDAARAEGFVVEPMGAGTDMAVVDASTEAEVSAALAQAFDTGCKKLLIVVACPTLAIFYGLGVERGVELDKPVPAASIAPTLAWLGDFPLPAQVEAAVAYPVLKGLNFKMREVHKLNDSMNAMMTAMERNNRKPWDKHDCA